MKEYLKCLGKIAAMLLAYFLLQAIVLMAFAAIGGAGAQGDIQAAMSDYIAKNAALITLVHNAVVIAALIAYFKMNKSGPVEKAGFAALTPAALWPVAVAASSSALLMCTLLSVLPIPDEVFGEYSALVQQSNASSYPIIGFISAVIIAPIAEELLFRGAIYGALKGCAKRPVALIVSCTVFAAMHGNLIWAIYAFGMGVALTLVYDLYGTLKASIVFHMVFNLVGLYAAALLGGVNGLTLLMLLLIAVASLPVCINSMREQCGHPKQ